MNRNEKVGLLTQLREEFTEKKISGNNTVRGIMDNFEPIDFDMSYLLRFNTRTLEVLVKDILKHRKALEKLNAEITALETELGMEE